MIVWETGVPFPCSVVVLKCLVIVFLDIASRDKQISELKRKFLESQKLEHKARQERDELQGKTIIMESL